jgi:hypothetical protein
MDKIDLEELERVAADYDRRKEAARTFEIENFGSTTEERARYLAALKYGEATKAFEALRPLVERVRELERQRDEAISYILSNEGASMIDCRMCFFVSSCECGPKQCEPNREMCEQAVRKVIEEAGE